MNLIWLHEFSEKFTETKEVPLSTKILPFANSNSIWISVSSISSALVHGYKIETIITLFDLIFFFFWVSTPSFKPLPFLYTNLDCNGTLSIYRALLYLKNKLKTALRDHRGLFIVVTRILQALIFFYFYQNFANLFTTQMYFVLFLGCILKNTETKNSPTLAYYTESAKRHPF